ncbi:MAG TPA: transposase [Acidobacteriaceae bacterium]|nr:transposase [Acidobacteriaceae bacterium]
MRPTRERTQRREQTYFVSSQTGQRKPFFRYERWAALMQEVLQHYRGGSYLLHAYVIMPDHFHILISPKESLERAMQNIRGGFSFRAKRAFEWNQDIWQAGFSDHRIRDNEDWNRHILYILHNPVKAGLCERSEDYKYVVADLDPAPQRLKPLLSGRLDGGAEAPPLQSSKSIALPLQTSKNIAPRLQSSKSIAAPLQRFN